MGNQAEEMAEILLQLKINADIISIDNSGTLTKYYLKLNPGAKVSKIENCSTEIALGIKSYSKPIIKVVLEQGLVVLEVLSKPINFVGFSELACDILADNNLPILLGRTHDGKDLTIDLTKMPHLLVAGTTGSGKSVLLHSMIASILTFSNANLVLIDPKKVEFSHYANIKELLFPIITETEEAGKVLSDLISEMENRFKFMSKHRMNNISMAKGQFKYIVLVIDEFSDLNQTSKKEFQNDLCRLAQKSRACGIHIIMATQRPSVDVVTGLIKANFPTRISCRVPTLVDSRVILGCSGAEKLLGNGDSLINVGSDLIRFQGAFLSQSDIIQLSKAHEMSWHSKIFNMIGI